jgi:hypothetical protein
MDLGVTSANSRMRKRANFLQELSSDARVCLPDPVTNQAYFCRRPPLASPSPPPHHCDLTVSIPIVNIHHIITILKLFHSQAHSTCLDQRMLATVLEQISSERDRRRCIPRLPRDQYVPLHSLTRLAPRPSVLPDLERILRNPHALVSLPMITFGIPSTLRNSPMTKTPVPTLLPLILCLKKLIARYLYLSHNR